MPHLWNRPVAFLLAAALAVGGCSSDLTTEETSSGPFATGGLGASHMARAASSTTAESLATGSTGAAVATATTFIIAKHQASVRQKKVAEERARRAVARLRAERAEPAPTKKKSRAADPEPRATSAGKKKKKKMPRYIAVETVKDERTSPQAKKAIVVWDTQTEEIVGNNVYDVTSPPAIGATAQFETYAAEYVGAGS